MTNIELCAEKHKQVDDRFQVLERRVNKHSEKIDDLAEDSREYKIQIQNLCKQIEDLTKTIKWYTGLLATSLIGFFIYAVQSKLF
ncbi:hemolysin XhlA family protein [Geosporobacter ferrireducens]|uniref:hemolysin XhlA family protein n=1 Tax=Geosporobacter ferrireducens TaxID=1424294 RepID=UPI00139BE17D|nr:hemolysin XhlA family protein [Geosporobacter ferrireducens]MTI56171.1 hypothetical protein [Geosporobacter ferrireducens]